MGTIKAYRKKHWVVALDADLASIPSPLIGDTALTEDKGKLYYKTAAGWKTGLGYEYVERLINAYDKTKVDFTADGNPHVNGLDLSGIVPAGAVAVILRVFVNDDAAGSNIVIYRDAAHTKNGMIVKVSVANLGIVQTEPIAIDTDRLLDYEASNLVFTNIDVAVCGWFI